MSFFLNGKAVTIEDPEPSLLLIDYLRSPAVGLTGAKKGCGEGGCGACTVILSRWDEERMQVEHRAINSCLRPVCALGGLAVTTVEGTGAVVPPPPSHLQHAAASSRAAAPAGHILPSVRAAGERAAAGRARLMSGEKRALPLHAEPPPSMNPVAHRLAANNGTQCGYCTTGFVMNMSALLADNPAPTKRQIEDIFDGNICRCTGYRPILTGMKTFASDWTREDEANRMKCLLDDGSLAQDVPRQVSIPFPGAAKHGALPVTAHGSGQTWMTPVTLNELIAVLRENRGKKVRMVHGNTSFGVYPDEILTAELLVDIRLVADLYGIEVKQDAVEIGAATTMNQLIDALTAAIDARKDTETSRLGAVLTMAQRTAGTLVRNAATLAGNTMLVLTHIHAGEPFPSDSLTALAAIDAEIEFISVESGARSRLRASELVAQVAANGALAGEIVIVRYSLPTGRTDEVTLPQKVALREVNSHSIVNATTRLGFGVGAFVTEATLVLGGIAPYPWRADKTAALLVGKPLALADYPALAAVLADETRAELRRWEARMAGLPSEGITIEYKVDLALAFLYKAMVNALIQRAPYQVPDEVRSSGEMTWGHWPLSDGSQFYESQAYKKPVGQPYIKLGAMLQASGQLHYTQEIAIPPRGENGAFVLSLRALASYFLRLPGGGDTPVSRRELCEHLAAKYPSFRDLITWEQIPEHGINDQGMGADQPLFAEKQVSYVGQSIALVLATTEQAALAIASYVTSSCIGYGPPAWQGTWGPEWYEPVLSLDQAIRMNSIFPDCPSQASFNSHIWKITRPGSSFAWMTPDRDPLSREIILRDTNIGGAPSLVVESTQTTGGQLHFYMETQACVVEPRDGGRLLVLPGSQSPMAMQQTAAMAAGMQYNKLQVQIPPVGGAYGGKTEPARFVTGPAVVAAVVRKETVRIAMSRASDSSMIGKRHPYYGQTQIAVDRGELRPEDRGKIHGLHVKMWGDGGAFYDCSFIVSNCIQLRADNAYRIPSFESQIDVCRTNTAPNTAMRAFGDIQGKLIVENAVDDAAFALGMPPNELREKNMYVRGDVTPFGQALSYCYMKEVWAYLEKTCDYASRKKAVDAFNAKNRWRKRGIYMVPNKYGSGYNLVQLEQAAAVVSVYSADGSIIINQGGVDHGQGLITQAAQVASYVLNVPMQMIAIQSADTGIIPNPTSSGASTGTPYAAEAVKRVCGALRSRLMDFGYAMLKEKGNDWCHAQGIDFWNYGEAGWAAEVPGSSPPKLVWQNLVAHAYEQRVSLVFSDTTPMRGGTTPIPAFEYKPADRQPEIPGIVAAPPDGKVGGAVDSFTGFTYSAACSEVEVDILTGEVKVLRSDIVYDAGWSLNPAIDIGQVEGAFVQGIGYVLSEHLVFQPDGDERGRLNATNTWRYKPPAISTIPLQMNTYLFPRNLASNVPEEPNNVFSAKEIGEPPLVLANSVFFAVKDAIRASRCERGESGIFRLDAPATVQEVRRACAVAAPPPEN